MYSRLDSLFCVAFTDHHSFIQSQQIELTVSSDKHLWNHCSSTPFSALPQLSTWWYILPTDRVLQNQTAAKLFCRPETETHAAGRSRSCAWVLWEAERTEHFRSVAQKVNKFQPHQLHPSHTCLTAKYLTSLICTKLINPSLLTLINWYNSDVSCDVPFYY